jgi:hypothetical protein
MAESQATLHQALDQELTYGGRFAWLCYYALGRASLTPAEARQWYDKALGILQATASSLHTRPQLQAKLLADGRLRWLMEQTQAAG